MKLILVGLGVLGGIYLSYEYPAVAKQIWDTAWHYFLIAFNWLESKVVQL